MTGQEYRFGNAGLAAEGRVDALGPERHRDQNRQVIGSKDLTAQGNRTDRLQSRSGSAARAATLHLRSATAELASPRVSVSVSSRRFTVRAERTHEDLAWGLLLFVRSLGNMAGGPAQPPHGPA